MITCRREIQTHAIKGDEQTSKANYSLDSRTRVRERILTKKTEKDKIELVDDLF